jgi:hypothetical protein
LTPDDERVFLCFPASAPGTVVTPERKEPTMLTMTTIIDHRIDSRLPLIVMDKTIMVFQGCQGVAITAAV